MAAHSTIRNLLKLTAIAAVAGFAFTGTASAHNIPYESAKAKCKAYAQGVVDGPKPFTKAHIYSEVAFPGHNHYVRCTISYDTPSTAPTKYYACIETLDVYYLPEGSDRSRIMFMRHTSSRVCGPKRLYGPTPG